MGSGSGTNDRMVRMEQRILHLWVGMGVLALGLVWAGILLPVFGTSQFARLKTAADTLTTEMERLQAANRKMVESECFVVRDSDGKQRASLAAGADGVGLFLLDENGKLRVTLLMGHDNKIGLAMAGETEKVLVLLSPKGLGLHDDKGALRAGLTIQERGSALLLSGEKGCGRVAVATTKTGPTVSMQDENGTVRAQLSSTGLSLHDEKGIIRAFLEVEEEGSGLVLSDEKGTDRAILAASKNGPLLGLFGQDGTPRASLTAREGAASLFLARENGEPMWTAP